MRRNAFEIQADLLGIAVEGSRKTRLVYQGNLNFNVIKPHLERMLKAGLMDLIDGFYITTEKGRRFIQRFQALTDLQ